MEVELRILRLQALLTIRRQITVKTLLQERASCDFITRSKLIYLLFCPVKRTDDSRYDEGEVCFVQLPLCTCAVIGKKNVSFPDSTRRHRREECWMKT